MSGSFDSADNRLKRWRIVKYDCLAEALGTTHGPGAIQALLLGSQRTILIKTTLVTVNMRLFRFAAFILVACALASPAFVTTDAHAAGQEIGLKVGRPLKEAQDLSKSGKYEAALAKAKEAEAVSGKTPYETFVVDDFIAFLSIKTKNYAAAARAYEAGLATGQVKDRAPRLKTLSSLYYQTGNYSKAIEFGQQYEKEAGTDSDVDMLIVQSYYLQKDYGSAEKASKALVDAAHAAGRAPDKSLLQIWQSSAYQLKDRAGGREALTRLVTYYPSQEYWTSLLDMVATDIGRSDRLSFEVFRLKLAAGQMKKSEDYVEMAQLALQLGLPGEARSVIERGFASKVLGGANKSRETRLLNMAKTQADQGRAALATPAVSAKDKAASGEAYASYGEYGKALALYQAALADRKLPDADLVRLHVGQALLASGDRKGARSAFASIRHDPKLAQIAEIWMLVVDRNS